MKNLEEQMNTLRNEHLRPERKRVMKDAIVRHMKENPILTTGFVRNSPDARLLSQQSIKSSFIIFNPNLYKHMTIALILALLLGGGTSFAAEGSLPGDILYPVKIHVNENVQTLAAFSDSAEARAQANLAERRLKEAEQLTSENRLQTEVAVSLRADYENHSEKSAARVKEMAKKDNAAASQVSSEIEAKLSVHKNILGLLLAGDSEEKVGSLLSSVNTSIGSFEGERVRVEAELKKGPEVEAAAKGSLGAAENKIAEVEKYLEQKKAEMNASASVEASARLDAAKKLMVEGKAKLEAKAYGEAFDLFKKAAMEAERAKEYAKIRNEIKAETKIETDVFGSDNKTEDRNNEDEKKEDSGNQDRDNDDISVDLNATGTVNVGGIGAGTSGNGDVRIEL